MQRKKMEEMLKAGVNPIEVSQEKWREIRKSVERSDYSKAWDQDANCALCHAFLYDCARCPLHNCNDDDSSYDKATNAIRNRAFFKCGTKQEVLKAIDNMIQALEDLKA